jgi:hypothetical protein
MDPFTVPAGAEAYHCQDFANPFGGDAEIQTWESHMTVGSHHLLVFYKANATNGPLESEPQCSGLEFMPGPYGAQAPDVTITYPAGVAAFVAAGNGLRLNSHYLNATGAPINATVQVIARRATPGTVQNHSGVFFFNNVFGLNIPAGAMNYPVTKTCSVPNDVYFMFSVAHMHKHALSLLATVGGQTIYSTNTWDNAQFSQYTPPMLLKAGTQVTWTCTYNNDTTAPLTFGESANTNEMCIFDGQFYPDPMGQGFGCM